MHKIHKNVLYSLASLFLLGLNVTTAAYAASYMQSKISPQSSSPKLNDDLKIIPIAQKLPKSWAIKVSPNNELFMTQRSGVLHQFAIDEKNSLSQITLVHSIDLDLADLYAQGQGGLLAIAFPPDHKTSKWLYLSYSFGSAEENGLKVIRVKLNKDKVVEKETIFTQKDLRDTPVHYGGRMAFLNNGNLLVSIGDGFDYREQAQVATSQLGKILEITPNGVVGSYSLGHRNPQGLLVMPNGQIIAHEHGAEGGDEINFIKQGNNYGWPVITQGRDYLGGLISPFTEYQGMQQPDYDWTPSIAPSGMIAYKNSRLSAFQNRLLVTSLKFMQLHTLLLNPDNSVSNEQVHFGESGFRMRDITQTDSGRVYILSDGSGSFNSTVIFEVASQNQ